MSENVTPKDGFLLAALAAAAGRPASEVAKLAGVTERTIRRWNQRESFVSLVGRLRDEMLGAALGKLMTATAQAVDSLVSLLSSSNDNAKLGAAAKIIGLTLNVREQLELAKRVEEVEDMLKAWKADNETKYQRSSN